MPRFIALLRGVNVGKGNRVPMADFRALLERLDYGNVQTLLNSGNAAFTSSGRSTAKHATSIASAIEDQFGFSVRTIVKSEAELASIIQGNPINPPEADHSRFLVAFTQHNADLRTLEAIQPLATGKEKLAITASAAYLHCPNGVLGSRIGDALLGRPGRMITTRNWATVLKLAALVAELQAAPHTHRKQS